MARRFREESSEWGAGAITAASPDKLPANATPRARNVAFTMLGPSKRKGLDQLNASAPAGQPQFLALDEWKAQGLRWAIFANGKWKKLSAGAYADIDATVPTPFTPGTSLPSTAVANNLLFAVNGTEALKTDGTHIQKFGIAAPAAPTVTNTGVGGNPSGTYLFELTAYNANTGQESSASVSGTVTVAGTKIKVQWTFPTDTQVTHVRVHIFKTGLTDRYYQLTATDVTPDAGAYDATNGGYTSATSFVTVNVTDADINNLIIQTPSQTENNPPPSGVKFIWYHGSRMFATDGKFVYYSKTNKPESFDPNNVLTINANDGQNIIALRTLEEQHLLILKEHSTYQLVGPDDPNTWEIRSLDQKVGTRAPQTLIAAGGSLWWLDDNGYYTCAPGDNPRRYDSPNVSDQFENFNVANYPTAVSAYDHVNQRILLAVPGSGSTRNNILLPLNTRFGVWEDQWDPMDIAAFGTFYDATTGRAFVSAGGYKGRAFQVWGSKYLDGVRADDGAGTNFTLTGTVTASGANTLTDSGANFDVNGDGLAEVPVIVAAPDGSTQRNIIASNTGTVLTLLNNWTQVPTVGWTYSIGSPNFELDTKYFSPSNSQLTVNGEVDQGSLFNARNFKQFFVKGLTDTTLATVDVYAILNHTQSPFAFHTTVQFTGSGAQWDRSLWDVGQFGITQPLTVHRGLGLHGFVCGLRLVNRTPNTGVLLLSIGVLGTELSWKV